VHDYRRLLADAVGHPVGDELADVLDAALERLAASAAFATVVDVDDLIGEIAPHNVPGRVLPSSWRRRLPRPASAVLADLDVRRRIKLLTTRTRRADSLARSETRSAHPADSFARSETRSAHPADSLARSETRSAHTAGGVL
jgi:hypothetical protein